MQTMKIKNSLILISAVLGLMVLPACKDKKPVEVETPKVEIKTEKPKAVRPEPEKIYPLTTAPKKPEGRKITVYEGEWLYEISRREYGYAQGWVKIYNANKDKIKNPDIIYPKMELIIPE